MKEWAWRRRGTGADPLAAPKYSILYKTSSPVRPGPARQHRTASLQCAIGKHRGVCLCLKSGLNGSRVEPLFFSGECSDGPDRGSFAPHHEHLRPPADRAVARPGLLRVGRRTARPTWTRWAASPSTRWATTTPSWCRRCRTRSRKIIHSCNYYHVPSQEQLAAKLAELSGLTKVFFCSTGLEANEAALKMARKFGHDKGIERPEIVVYEKAFHGRSHRHPVGHRQPEDAAGLRPAGRRLHPRAAERHRRARRRPREGNPNVVAVFLETIQGEGGINPMRAEYLQQRARAVRRARLAADDRRGAVRHGPHRQVVRPPVGRHPARRDAAGQGPGLGRADRRRRGRPEGRRRASSPATTAPPSAATRWPCAPASRRIRIMEEDGLLENAAAVGAHLKAALARELGGRAGREGDPRPGPDDRHRAGPTLRRAGRPRRRSRAADQRHRRQRDPPGAAADPRRRAEADEMRRPSWRRWCKPSSPEHEAGRCADQALPAVQGPHAPTSTPTCSSAPPSSRRKFKNYEKYHPLADRTLAMIFEKATHAHARELRGRHVPDGRLVVHLTTGDSQLGRAEPIEDSGARDQPHGRPGDDPHLRAGQDRALRRALARAGDQRPDQRVPPLPDPGRHLHLHRAPRLASQGKTVAWVGDGNNMANTWLQAAELLGFTVHVSTPERLRGRPGRGRRRAAATATRSSRTRWTPAAAPTW